MWIGVIADTRDGLHPRVAEVLSSVDFIIHCGGIGDAQTLLELSNFAPISGVLAKDEESEELQPLGHELAKTFLDVPMFVRHDLGTPSEPSSDFPQILEAYDPKVFLFGRTKTAFHGTIDDRLWFNPGCGGPSRGDDARSVGILELEGQSVRGQIVPLN